jgi:tRNA A37 threonylcarbamoyladenosine dehydratase
MIIENVFGGNDEKIIRGMIENLPVIGCAKKFTTYLNTDVNKTENISALEKKLISKLRNDICVILTQLQSDMVFSKMSPEELLKEVKRLYNENYPLDNEDTCYLIERFEDYNDADIHGFIKQTMTDYLDKIIEEATMTEQEKTIESLKSQLKNNTDYIVNATDAIAKRRKENMEIGKRLKEEFGIEV